MDNDWFEVFTVIEDPEKGDFWLKIGRMIPHKNGDGGFNVLLNALPLNGKLVIKPKRKKTTPSKVDLIPTDE